MSTSPFGARVPYGWLCREQEAISPSKVVCFWQLGGCVGILAGVALQYCKHYKYQRKQPCICLAKLDILMEIPKLANGPRE